MEHRYERWTTAELAAAGSLVGGAVAVLPIAAIEQHGAHLPLGTDALLADAMVELVISRLAEEVPALFLPTLRIGASLEHTHFPGTLSQDWPAMVNSIVGVGEGLWRAGFRRVVIVSAHGGNTPAMDAAALELRARHGLLCATGSWLRFGYPEGLLPEAEIATGIHGGAVETSLMLHFHPDLVRREAIADSPSLQSDLAREATHLRAHGRLGFGWMADDLNPAGVVGDARLATAAIGAAIAAHQADGFVAFLKDVLAFDLQRLSAAPSPKL
ncbi:creatininase family protein [Aurantimonas sp. MSK8Z-1]|uniref:creatininase family protein n=1 Tax=Mangrovibrevibacter kandeliae TaxID=2968473 RepID=UPI0021174F7C|nr:creatininase family protein [Aurantimonas sp. MSK8Z-1]MCW4115333.1 creatininase family protein [Aurantimonas sp. MSK8Z-1]